jgi:hypothetical protein
MQAMLPLTVGVAVRLTRVLSYVSIRQHTYCRTSAYVSIRAPDPHAEVSTSAADAGLYQPAVWQWV